MKWGYLFNIDTFVILVIVVAVIYCLFTTKRKPKKFKFRGLGSSGWNVAEGSNFWKYGVSRKKAKQKLNKHEERCREIFQDIYRQKFKSIRPDWLKNPVTGKNLELDGYCANIHTSQGQGLAFEYDGSQHSTYNKHFHRNGPDEFLYQVKKDSWKDIRCKEEGVLLIRIPHFVAYEDLERYIKNKIGKLRIFPQRKQSFSGGLYG
uniref:Restriction endonuclease n=1 Tax=Marseillevirus LCMAC102 TaxID=2506603 RepID=A0A481YTP6_9VIRU|nr:MAG: restriction endonuclease [Marseillevirus LCMAC102]